MDCSCSERLLQKWAINPQNQLADPLRLHMALHTIMRTAGGELKTGAAPRTETERAVIRILPHGGD